MTKIKRWELPLWTFWTLFIFFFVESHANIPDHLYRLPLIGRSSPGEIRRERSSLLEPLSENLASLKDGKDGFCEGACISQRACEYYGGRSRGSCINGNICCKFERTCDGVSREKISFFQSPQYPSTSNDSFECSHVIYPNEDVCAFRVDFIELNISKGFRYAGGVHKCIQDNVYFLNTLDGPHEGLCEFQNYSAIFSVSPKGPKPITILFVLQSETVKWKIRVTQLNCKKVSPWTNEPNCGRQLMFEPDSTDNNGGLLIGPHLLGQGRHQPEPSSFVSPYVVNGKDADPREFPWQASIQVNSKHRCGASIINSEYLLTAAHCFANQAYESLDKMRVVVGDLILGSDEDGGSPQSLEVENIILNYDYKPFKTHINDIAIIKVKTKIQYNSDVQPICLAAKDFPTNNREAVTTGWGRLNATYPTTNSPRLQKLIMNIIPNKECKEMHLQELIRVTKKNSTDNSTLAKFANSNLMGSGTTHVCAITNTQSTVCFGDSGGPLAILAEEDSLYTQVGVTSYGLGACDVTRNTPVAFTRVSEFLQFISLATSSM